MHVIICTYVINLYYVRNEYAHLYNIIYIISQQLLFLFFKSLKVLTKKLNPIDMLHPGPKIGKHCGNIQTHFLELDRRRPQNNILFLLCFS